VGEKPQIRATWDAMMERQLVHLVRLVDDPMDVWRIGQGEIEIRRERAAQGVAARSVRWRTDRAGDCS
jgi:hypothetical protein